MPSPILFRRTLIVAALLASAALPTAATASAQPGDSYFFTTPSGQWHCGIVVSDGPAWAGCRGPVPASAPNVQGGGVASIHPNGVAVTSGQHAVLRFYSDVSVDPPGAHVLPYGRTVSAAGIDCRVDPTSGVTCRVGDHGFTISAASYQLR
ncbi:hypothetical protein HH308_20305 [Gordonia sp. TBRC 11910]|uniref:Uncharacterized protein n=1 Tax=Gordonia asplenii TaxID=2725283 RepID=A0A848L4P8_9ACTN|nr:hypothetical protein [Gordonia asplenii]NMO03563.1 hypothetical protein [Gordonia asplenii]